MIDQALYQKLFDDLHKAVDKGLLARDVLQVGGNVSDSVLLIGNNNTVTFSQPLTTAAIAESRDERALLLESLVKYREQQAELRQETSDLPYPGLQAYGLQDAYHFFGRERATAELIAEMDQAKVVWLHGRSGAGKSSLIYAGLMPALLEKGALPILVRPFDEQPTKALKKELLRRHWANDLELANMSLLQFLAHLDEHLAGQPLFLFFDQFEEFFIKLPGADRETFARELADCLADTRLPTHFIFSLRSDYYGETMPLRQRLQASDSREYFLSPLTPDEARQIIVRPVEMQGITYQENLVDTILADLGTKEFDSPQLQLVCEKLFRALPKDGRQITLEQYQGLGRARGIINEYLNRVLRDRQVIPANQYKAACYLLSTLVTPEGQRDFKRLSDWIVDERLRAMSLAWHAERKNLPMADGTIGLQTLHYLAIADYIQQVEPHVSIQGEDLKRLIQELTEPVTSVYVHQLQKAFVTSLVQALLQIRLLHEVQTEAGELTYELVHDYLIAEVQSWLDVDEQEARRLRRMLSQKQLDFQQHQLLLEPKELAIVAAQLENPKLEIQEADKRLLLLSAVAHGSGQQWLVLSGENGLDWLRQAYQDDSYPQSVRLGAAACLGETNDQPTFEQLYEAVTRVSDRPKKPALLNLLAHYLHHTSQQHRLPWSLTSELFPRLARLRVKDGAAKRAYMCKIAYFTAPLCAMMMMASVFIQRRANSSVVSASPQDYFFIAIIFGILGVLVSYSFAEVMTSLTLITRRWAWAWQTLILAGTGSIIGIVLFLILAGENGLWFEGGIIGLALALLPRGPGHKPGWYPAVPAIAVGVLVFALSLITLLGVKEKLPIELCGAALSTGLFTGVYIYNASQEK